MSTDSGEKKLRNNGEGEKRRKKYAKIIVFHGFFERLYHNLEKHAKFGSS